MSERVFLARVAAAAARPLALAAGALALSGASDTEPERARPCRAAASAVQIYEGSRLFDGPGERLELVRGRALGCDDPRARRVLVAVDRALTDFPRERLHEPLRIHLEPRLPARQAPLSAIEVHLTSREVLLARAAFGALGPEAWRHELFHTLAAELPPMSSAARRLWLTLEEGVVGYLTLATGGTAESATRDAVVDPWLASQAKPPARVLPLLEWLSSPAYDPHPLAVGLTRELARVEPHARLEAWLDCLSAVPDIERDGSGSSSAAAETSETRLPAALTATFRAFIGRCSADEQATFSTALAGWWGEPRMNEPGKAAARNAESR
jgi:hypothetical protein